MKFLVNPKSVEKNAACGIQSGKASIGCGVLADVKPAKLPAAFKAGGFKMKFLVKPKVVGKNFGTCGKQCDHCGRDCFQIGIIAAKGCDSRCFPQCGEFLHY